jgi:hypothetical protein
MLKHPLSKNKAQTKAPAHKNTACDRQRSKAIFINHGLINQPGEGERNRTFFVLALLLYLPDTVMSRKTFISSYIPRKKRHNMPGGNINMEYYEYLLVCLIGCLGYGGLEILWRSYTHWTMLLCGGVCFVIIYIIANRPRGGIIAKSLACTGVITGLEFLVGCLVNLALGWEVWDYSSLPMNLLGQICLPYTLLWLCLSLPCVILSRAVKRALFTPQARRQA